MSPFSRQTLLVAVLFAVASACQTGDVATPGDHSEAISGGRPWDGSPVLEPVDITPLDRVLPGGLYEPSSISAAHAGLFCATDVGSNRVFVFDDNLAAHADFGEAGSGPGGLTRPSSCAVTEGGEHVLVLDSGQSLVKEFGLDGVLLDTWRVRGASSRSAVSGRGVVITVPGGDLSTLIIQAGENNRRILEVSSSDCRGSGRGAVTKDGQAVTLGAQASSAVSADGRWVAFSQQTTCGSSDYSTIARVDLETELSDAHLVAVFDDFRQRSRLSAGPNVHVLRRPAIDGKRAYFLHAFRRPVGDHLLTPLDVWPHGHSDPVRIYVGVPMKRFERTRLTLMTSTPDGDLLIIDEMNGTLLRFSSTAVDAAVLEGR